MAPQLPAGLELFERIGEGGIADVFRGVWEGRPVALKVLREPERPGLRKRFIREGRILRRLSHPGLVRCHAVLDGPQPVLVLELLLGASLDIRLRDGPLPPEDVVGVAAGALRALGHLHEHGIVHRDIKSSNLWINEDGSVVLVDLGLAADNADPLTTTLGDVLGTHAYMAPEQIAGAESDHRCDLYSLGITLYEALCGERPYQASGLAGYLHAHRAAGAPPIVDRVRGVPVRLAALIDRLMARDPAARPASAAVALAQLLGARGARRGLEAPPLVGREAASGAIQAALDGGGVLRVTGELGSGLGAVARHATSIARSERIEYATLRCRPRLRLKETLGQLARELEAVVGTVPPTLPAVVTAIETLVRQDERFLVVVEDLDLAPPGFDLVVGTLARIPGLTLIVTARALGEEPRGREVVLRPLSPQEVRRLVSGLLGTRTLPAGLDAAAHRASGGLPAFVVGILREQLERGAIWCEDAGEEGEPRWAWDSTAPLLPGEGTTRLFGRALASLPPGSLRLVRVAAVAGEPIPLDLLLHAADVDLSGLDLGPALRQGILSVHTVDGEERVAVRRAVIEPVLVAGLDGNELRDAHLRLADAARMRPIREWEQRFILLHLALGAREPDDTARLVGLGEWLVEAGRPGEALEVLNAATRLPLDGARALASLALARSDALVQLGRLPEARLAFEAGRAVAAEGTDVAVRERAALTHLDLALALGVPLPEEGEALLEAPLQEPSARRLLAIGAMRLTAGHLGEAERWYGRALERAAPGPVDRVGVAARLALARIAAMRGEPARASAQLRALAAELRAVGRRVAACEALIGLAEASCIEGRLSRAWEALGAAQELAGELGAPWIPVGIALGRARVLLAVDDLDGAAVILRNNARSGDAAAPWWVRRDWLGLVAELRERSGDTPAALAAHLRAVEAARGLPDATLLAYHSGVVGILTADTGAVGAAVDALASFAVPGLLSRLLLLGGVTGRDADVLEAAEAEARAANDALLLCRILHQRRDPADGEAASICLQALDGLTGALRERLLEAPATRWAIGERAAGRRDTGG
jgi:tetratricopeptide (TPR) repeat protein